MSRNDGKPRAAVSLKLDPLPYEMTVDGVTVRSANATPGFPFELKPRPGFILDEEAYQ